MKYILGMFIARLLGRVYGWEPKRDEISPSLARALAGQAAAALMLDANRERGMGGYELAIACERERARNALMVGAAMVAGATSDVAALETLRFAGQIFRGELDPRVRRS